MRNGPLSEEQVSKYHLDGFLFIRELFDAEEVALLRTAAKDDRAIDQNAQGRDDGEGGSVRLALWNHPGNGIYGVVARCRRMVDAVEQLLDDEAYHYHSKMIMKDARVGGAWAWHQDYGYWYHQGVLTPNLCSVFVAVDPATKENGCLQLLRGSHTIGRVDHVLTGDQAGADPERVAAAEDRFELVYAEMAPGDVAFFHSNTLHRSDQNRSEHPRWGMVCCYNARSNSPFKDGQHPNYTPLKKACDSEVKATGSRRFALDDSDPAFLDRRAKTSTAERFAK